MNANEDFKLSELTATIRSLMDNGVNYAVSLQARVFPCVSTDDDLVRFYELAAQNGLVWRHKDITQKNIKIGKLLQTEEVKSDIFKQISKRGDEGAGPLLSDSQQEVLETKLLPELWQRVNDCLLYTSPSPRDRTRSRMPSSA